MNTKKRIKSNNWIIRFQFDYELWLIKFNLYYNIKIFCGYRLKRLVFTNNSLDQLSSRIHFLWKLPNLYKISVLTFFLKKTWRLWRTCWHSFNSKLNRKWSENPLKKQKNNHLKTRAPNLEAWLIGTWWDQRSSICLFYNLCKICNQKNL